MASKICSECGGKISSKADFCPYCGKKKKKISFLNILLIFIAISLFVGLIDDIKKSSSHKTKTQSSRIQFEKDIEIHYGHINIPLQTNNYEYVISELKLFKQFNMIDYKNIRELYINALEFKVSKIPYSDFQSNFDIYKELSSFDPENDKFKKKLNHYQNKLNRVRLIENHFSSWNGSHNGLTEYIKKFMHDPSSYKHVETFYNDYGNYLVIKTKFRGKNAFGGIVINSISAKVDLNGNVIEILTQYP
jgi:hypothetical protein